MSGLSEIDIQRVEADRPMGISSAEVVSLFRDSGERFSEASLRKYVQLGLLPKSRRVGKGGRHRGSSGLYPVAIVRLIQRIKEALARGYTLNEIRHGFEGLESEVHVLRTASSSLLSRFAEAIGGRRRGGGMTRGLERALERRRRALRREIDALESFARRVTCTGDEHGESADASASDRRGAAS